MPKRKATDGPVSTAKNQRRRRSVGGANLPTETAPAPPQANNATPSQPEIDYDRLAAAIIKISPVPGAPPVTATTQPVEPPQEQPINVPAGSPAETHPGGSTPNIGLMLDQMFLGGLQSSPFLECRPDCSSSGTFANLSPICQQLLVSALSPSTAHAYRRTWEMFISWRPILALPATVEDVCNFIGYLFSSNYSPSSIASHISAISYPHKLLNLNDPTQAFITKKILKGCQSTVPTKDTRLPITPNILQKMLKALVHTVPQYSLRILLRAFFLLAFHAFLRLGEIAVKSFHSSEHVLQRSDVSFEYKGSQLSAVQIIMREYKTNKQHTPLVISLQAIPGAPLCPVHALFDYLQYSKHTTGPLFQTADALPISYAKVTSYLKSTIQFIGLNPNHFKGHSFRIGAATHAASLGYSENVIQKLGRWNSDAFRRYIRINSFRL